MTIRTLLSSASALAATALLTSGALAQTLDYTAMSELFGEPVTAGATGAPQRSSDVPATMIIITQDDIARTPEYDIPGVLRHHAGLNVTRYAFGDGQASIRGAATGYTPRLLVLVNGRDVYLDSYGYTAWSTLPVQLDEIQQIEVVKGPQSALYGFNAVAGVINIITRNPQHGDYGNVRVNAGGSEYFDLAMTGGYSLNDRVAVRASYGTSESNEFMPVPGNNYADALSFGGGGFQRETGALEVRLGLTDKVSLTAEATFSDVEQSEMGSIYYAGRSHYELESYKGELEADTDYGFVTLTAYQNRSEILYAFGPLSSELTTLRAQNLFKLGSNDTVRLSVEYRDGEAQSFPDPTSGDFGYESFAVSGMWSHKFSNSLDLTLAGRFDSVEWSRDGSPNPALYAFSQADYDQTIEEFSYNAALVWRPEFGGSVRAMASRGIQAPTMFDYGFAMYFDIAPGFGIALMGNPEIEPSIVDNLELAYDRTLSNGIEFRGAVFFQTTEDVKGAFGSDFDLLPPNAPAPTILFDNRGDTEIYGGEVSLSGDFNQFLAWDLNYTYQSAEDDLAGFSTETSLNFEEATPEHLVNAHLGWTDGPFTLDGYLNYVSEVDMPGQYDFGITELREVSAAWGLSFQAGYELNEHFGVRVNAQNVTYGDGEVVNTHHQNEARYWLSLVGRY